MKDNEISTTMRRRINMLTDDELIHMYANEWIDQALDPDIPNKTLPEYHIRINRALRGIIAYATRQATADRFIQATYGQECDYVVWDDDEPSTITCMLVDDQREVRIHMTSDSTPTVISYE